MDTTPRPPGLARSAPTPTDASTQDTAAEEERLFGVLVRLCQLSATLPDDDAIALMGAFNLVADVVHPTRLPPAPCAATDVLLTDALDLMAALTDHAARAGRAEDLHRVLRYTHAGQLLRGVAATLADPDGPR